jgi:hypothetical protein
MLFSRKEPRSVDSIQYAVPLISKNIFFAAVHEDPLVVLRNVRRRIELTLCKTFMENVKPYKQCEPCNCTLYLGARLLVFDLGP